MTIPRVSRPHFPEGYADHPKSLLPWEEVENKLIDAKHYWLCSVRSNGRPHSIPKWAVWVNGRLYFDGSPQTRHARNIAANPYISLHLESGEKAVIVEGTARELKPVRELAVQVAQAYTTKYAASGYSPQPDSWDAGGLFEIIPKTVIAWNSFTDDPTKFIFPAGYE
jgi:nitroimidazol reductase NimA-like FMN-containing flavoprotein (pyridoxamine 5'-phosphate oxidase superfamily)